MAQAQEVDSLVHLKESRNLALLDRAEAIEGIQRGLISMERGEGHPAAEVSKTFVAVTTFLGKHDHKVIVQPHILHFRHWAQRPMTADEI